jgi:hypothetical protein
MAAPIESEFEFDPDADLHWRALRYVMGELGPDEAEAFERRLDEDQAAREAVAQAVELAGAIAAQEPAAPVLPLRLGSRRPVPTVIAGVALAAAAALAWFVVLPGGPACRMPIRNDAATGVFKPTETVTLAWSTLREECDIDQEPDDAGILLAWNDELPPMELGEEASEPGPPPWLLDAAALAGRSGPVPSPAKEH